MTASSPHHSEGTEISPTEEAAGAITVAMRIPLILPWKPLSLWGEDGASWCGRATVTDSPGRFPFEGICQGVKMSMLCSILIKMEAHCHRQRGGMLHYLLLFFICFPKTGLFRFKWPIKLPPTSLHPVILQLISVPCTLYVKCCITRVSPALSSTSQS